MTEKAMRDFENMYQLKLIKVGEPVTQRQHDAIHYFFGSVIAAIPEPRLLGSVNFTESGSPYTTDGNPLGIKIDGKAIPNVSDSSQQKTEQTE